MAWGLVTSETPDSDKEICDYVAAKAAIQKWSEDTLAKTTAAGQDPSLGNMRVMHQLTVGGKAVKIEYHDDTKQVWVGSEPANEDVWHLLKGGFLTGQSIGGSYLWKRKEGDFTRYAPTIGEISYVDKSANPDAAFSYVKADGTTKLRKFAQPGPAEIELLHKIELGELQKAVAEGNTRLEKLSTQLDELVGKHTPAIGANMNPEQIKKCAAALGISEEEFKKNFAAADDLTKAHKGLAGLHANLETMHSHHEAMHKAHKAMGAMHEKMGTHIEKCMKACKDVMGSDEKEAEKALKALIDEMSPAPDADAVAKAAKAKADAEAAANGDKITKADAEKLVADAVKKAVDALPAPAASPLFSISRDNAVKKAEQIHQADPLPI